jgi:thiosulfate dehydrogenase
MKKLFLGILIGICLPLIAGYLFVVLGGMPVATKGDALPFERYLAKKAKRAAYKVDLDKKAPFELTAERLPNAIRIYKNNCGGCHGINSQENKMAKAMFPPVPQFFQPDHGVSHDPIGEIYWKVKNGVRLTGMPGYIDILSEEEIWEVSLFLKNGEKVQD